MKRVIFDRSIFHGERFLNLKKSPLASIVANKQLAVLYTAQFIEETLMFARKDPSTFLDQWHFLMSLNRTKWFRAPEEIVPIELGRQARRVDYQFLKASQIATVVRNAPRLAYNSVPRNELDETMNKVARNYDFRQDFRHTRINLRKNHKIGSLTFDEFVEEQAPPFIKNGLMLRHQHSSGFLKAWENHRSELGFTENYFRGWFVSVYLPLKFHSLKIDKNDRVDSTQLSFLYWADTFVSDDVGFLPKAFRTMFLGTDKELLTSKDFLSQLDAM